MRAVVQRVVKAGLTVGSDWNKTIGKGLVVLLGVGREDTEADVEYLVRKVVNLRIFDDVDGKMNLSVMDVKGSLLTISQFTLYGDCRKGNRPSWFDAAKPEHAKRLYELFVQGIKEYNVPVETGIFQAHMLLDIYNDGPVTLLLDSERKF